MEKRTYKLYDLIEDITVYFKGDTSPEMLRIRYVPNKFTPDGERFQEFETISDLKEIQKYIKNGKDKYLFILNKSEFIALLKEFNQLTIRLKLSSANANEQKEILETKLDHLGSFKREFIAWFEWEGFSDECDEMLSGENSNIDVSISNDGPTNMNPMELGDLSITERAEYFVLKARKDKKDGSHLNWKSIIIAEFGQDSYVYLGRIRDKFKKEHPGEKFNINGMAWYNKS